MGGDTAVKSATAAIAHPVRLQILTTANVRDISPSRYVEDIMGFDSKEEPEDYRQGLSKVSYHFRALEAAGCLEMIEIIPRRGSFEHVYRAVQRAHLSDREWANIPVEERIDIMTVTWQGLAAKVESARMAKLLQKRDDTWLAWTEADLDERGWSEMTEAIAANFEECERIRIDAEARLQETGEKPVNATFAMLGFESPTGVFYDRATAIARRD